MTARLNAVLATNKDFADAYHAGEVWAVQHAEMVKGVDGQANRQFPERTPKEDGKPHNWCGTCVQGGCVSCDLPGNHAVWKAHQMHQGE